MNAAHLFNFQGERPLEISTLCDPEPCSVGQHSPDTKAALQRLPIQYRASTRGSLRTFVALAAQNWILENLALRQ